MNVLVVGSGAREHALAWKLAQSSKVDALFAAPGNAGTAALGTNWPDVATDTHALVDRARGAKIGLTLFVDGTEHAHGKSRSREWLAVHDALRQSKLTPQLANLIFEQQAQRFDQAQRHRLGQAADVMMRLDLVRGLAVGSAELSALARRLAVLEHVAVADLTNLMPRMQEGGSRRVDKGSADMRHA